MFNWICPTCGRECQPHQTECPNCAPAKKAADAPAESAPIAPETPAAATADVRTEAPAPAEPIVMPSVRSMTSPVSDPGPPAPPARQGLPTWLMSIVFAFAFGGLFGGAYWVYDNLQKDSSAAAAPRTKLENPPPAAPAKSNPYQKYVEVTGLRLLQNKDKKTEARFVVVNHSGADLADIAGTLELVGKAAKVVEPVGRLTFKVAHLGPYESQDISALVTTKLQVYELPDWQYLEARLQINTP